MINTLIATMEFGLASFELYCGLSGNSNNPALSLAVSMFLFGLGILATHKKDWLEGIKCLIEWKPCLKN